MKEEGRNTRGRDGGKEEKGEKGEKTLHFSLATLPPTFVRFKASKPSIRSRADREQMINE